MATYTQVLSVIDQYYNGTDAWAALTSSGIMDDPNAIQILESMENVSVIKNGAGDVIGIDLLETFSGFDPVAEAEYIIDSNIAVAEYGANAFNTRIPSNLVGAGSGSALVSGAKWLGSASVATSVAGFVTLASACVPLATKLGKTVAQGLYNVAPDFWRDNFPSWDPTTWDELTTIANNDIEAGLMRVMFSVDEPQKSTIMYINEKALAYMYGVLVAAGVYDVGAVLPEPSQQETIITVTSLLSLNQMYHVFVDELASYIDLDVGLAWDGLETWYLNHTYGTGKEYAIIAHAYVPFTKADEFTGSGATTWLYFEFIPVEDGQLTVEYYASGTDIQVQGHCVIRLEDWSSSRSGKLTFSTADAMWYNDYPRDGIIPYHGVTVSLGEYYYHPLSPEYAYSETEPSNTSGWRKVVSNINGEWNNGVEGITTDTTPGTKVPNPKTITGTDVATILQQLKQQYPALFNGSVYEDIPQTDGTTKRITYVPVPMAVDSPQAQPQPQPQPQTSPNTLNQTQPVTGTAVQTDVEIEPETAPESLIKEIITTITTTADPPNTGSGNTPVVVVPVGTASSMWKIYNPTEAELNSFASWLWTDNLIEQFKKLFNSPMDAVIGVHKVFASPSIGGRTNIKCGYLDSGVASNYIDSQYVTIDCGTVSLREYFGNVFDYSPYTEISLFLPFIGIVKLDNADVMRADISIKYSVDVLTGACLAEVKVIRDGAGGNLYVYSGSAIVQYPLTSGSYAGAIAGVLSIAGGLAGTILSGGSLIPATVGVINGASKLRADVQKSGGFSGCAGAMGGKIPYLIISRPQTAMANNFQHYTGLPANSLVTLSACSGRTRIKAIHVENINKATNEEKSMIEQLLKAGVTI